jgi:hypothetical protein
LGWEEAKNPKRSAADPAAKDMRSSQMELYLQSNRPRAQRCELGSVRIQGSPQHDLGLIIVAGLLAVFFATNLVYQLLRKPVEVVAPLNCSWNKTPEETWRHYAPLFREYWTANVPAELLAALAQVEGAGNPIASPSWRWRLTGNPLKICQPASSAIGMYQMTDGAFADARRYCIQNHVVVENGCPWNGLDSRLVPRRAIELTSVFWIGTSRRYFLTVEVRGRADSGSRSLRQSFISVARFARKRSPAGIST